MNRRGFLKLLAVAPIAAAVGPAVLRPHRWGFSSDICQECYCSAEQVEDGIAPRYCEGERFTLLPPRIDPTEYTILDDVMDGPLYGNFSNRLSPSSVLNERSLEELVKQINTWADVHGRSIALRPTMIEFWPMGRR